MSHNYFLVYEAREVALSGEWQAQLLAALRHPSWARKCPPAQGFLVEVVGLDSELQNLWANLSLLSTTAPSHALSRICLVPPPSETWEGAEVEVSLLCSPEVPPWLLPWGPAFPECSRCFPGLVSVTSWSRISGEVP